jgi:hypothetical protein
MTIMMVLISPFILPTFTGMILRIGDESTVNA